MSGFVLPPTDLPDVVHDVPAGGWRPRFGASYDRAVLMKKASAMAHLVNMGWPQGQAKLYLETYSLQTVIYGADMAPGMPPIFVDPETGQRKLNVWVAPTLQPKAGDFPTIRRNIEWVSRGDPDGYRWILHKLAQRVQFQNQVSKVALVFSTTQGAGKGFLFRVMSEIMGPKNCATVTHAELESRFFARYAHMLILLLDEASAEGVRDNSSRMKVLIDGGEIEAERKYENATTIRSRMMWMIASNDPVSPVTLDGSDRRYTFFSNFDSVPPDYTTALNACFEQDRVTPTAGFLAEIAGFADYLYSIDVDTALVSKPYKNDARAALIDAGRPSHETFCREVDEHGFDSVYAAYKDREFLTTDSGGWDFQDKGVAFSMLYKVYRSYCKESGQHSLRLNKFGGAVRAHVPAWEHVRNEVETPKGKRRVWCYIVPRLGKEAP